MEMQVLKILSDGRQAGASDILIVSGGPLSDKTNGRVAHAAEEKLTPDIYTYKKEEIRRLEKRRERGRDNRDRDNANIFAGMDAATKKEMEELMKDE